MSTAFIVPATPRSSTRPPTGPDWLHEIKFDGWRAQVNVEGGKAIILTRNGNDTSKRFSSIAADMSRISCKSAIIDAELVAVDGQGRCDFRALMRRDPGAACIRAFDLLAINGEDMRHVPLVVRRVRLQRLVAKSKLPTLLFSDAFDDPVSLLAAAERFGLEGIVTNNKTALYVSGGRCGWLKGTTRSWLAANRERWHAFA